MIEEARTSSAEAPPLPMKKLLLCAPERFPLPPGPASLPGPGSDKLILFLDFQISIQYESIMNKLIWTQISADILRYFFAFNIFNNPVFTLLDSKHLTGRIRVQKQIPIQ